MILDVILEFVSSAFSLPTRLATISVAVLMFVCGTAFLAITIVLVINAASTQGFAVIWCLLLALSFLSYWFFYRAICELRKSGGGA